MTEEVTRAEKDLESAHNSGALSQTDRIRRQKAIIYLRELESIISNEDDPEAAFETVKQEYNLKVKKLSKTSENVKKTLSNMFAFSEDVFGEGQELLIIVTELTANYNSARFISEFGCEEYFRHNRELLFYERQQEIITKIENLGL